MAVSKPDASAGTAGRVLYRTEFEKGVLISNFEKRGWERAEEDGPWNFFWATKESARSVFNPGAVTEEGPPRLRLNDRQMINHFPNHLEITRKDNLAKNCKRYAREWCRYCNPLRGREFRRRSLARYRKEMEREGQTVPEIVPLTFQLPQEYSLFVDHASRAGPSACWIAKPVGKSQGQGIYLFTKLSKIKHFQAAAGTSLTWASACVQVARLEPMPAMSLYGRFRKENGGGTTRGV
jgi:tubulin polyglutamylase TTLL1